ncbi:hypothetical protein TNCV_3807551 [Trichonephila clavipes]|nr:hypothetical protein TNCV_3807551 [Trichonephila clavipes]
MASLFSQGLRKALASLFSKQEARYSMGSPKEQTSAERWEKSKSFIELMAAFMTGAIAGQISMRQDLLKYQKEYVASFFTCFSPKKSEGNKKDDDGKITVRVITFPRKPPQES